MSRLVVLCGFRGGRSNDRLERTGPAGVSILRGEMSLLRRRDFLLIFGAFALSALGDYVALITLTLRVQETTGSGWAVAALLLTGLVPPVLLAPVAGLLVDRLETVRVLVVTALLQAAVAAAMALTPEVFPTLGLSFLLGVGLAVTQPALFALLPRAVGEDRTTQANAFLEVARWGGAAAGPVLAAVLSETFGAGSTLLANAGTFVAVAVLVSMLRVRRRPEPPPEGAPAPRGQAREGLVFIAREPLLRLVVPMVGLMVVFAAADNVAEVFFAKGVELVGMRSLLHRRVPDRLRGRAFSLYFGMVQAAQIVALGVSGGLVEAAGARMTMVIAGAGTAAVGVVGTFLFARIPSGERRTTEPASVPPWVPA